MTDSTQELEEILEGVANEYSAGGNYENAKPLMVEEAEQAVLDWHNKQIEEVLDKLVKHFDGLRVEHYDVNIYLELVVEKIEAERNKLKGEAEL